MLDTKKFLTGLLLAGFLSGGMGATAQPPQQVTCQGISAAHFNVKDMLVHHLTDKIDMRFLTSSHFTVIQWDLKKGARLVKKEGARLMPFHTHVNEQVTRVLKGKVEVYTEDEVYVIGPDDIVVFPPYVSHGFVALTDVTMYEQQTPVRQDFLRKGFIEELSEYLKKNQ